MELVERENQSEETPMSPEAFVISKSRILLNFCPFLLQNGVKKSLPIVGDGVRSKNLGGPVSCNVVGII